jgi:GAF domain
MSERPRPAKSQSEARRPATRKSPKNDAARVRDLEKRLAEALRSEAEALGKLQARDSELLEAQEQQTVTSEILRVISNSLTNLQPVMDSVAQNAARVCSAADDASIFRIDGYVLRRVAQFGLLPDSLPVLPLTREIPTARSVVDRQTIHIADVHSLIETEFPGLKPIAPAQSDIHTVLATPLMREGAPMGAILIRRMQIQPFTDKQVDLLKIFADQAVIAIENVRLFTELEKKNRALTEALERQTATSEILRVISSSPTDVQPIFDAIARNAVTPRLGTVHHRGRRSEPAHARLEGFSLHANVRVLARARAGGVRAGEGSAAPSLYRVVRKMTSHNGDVTPNLRCGTPK